MFNSANGVSRQKLPPVTLNLLIINVALWLVCSLMPDFGDTIYDNLGLHYWSARDFNPIQPITYMFLQAPGVDLGFQTFPDILLCLRYRGGPDSGTYMDGRRTWTVRAGHRGTERYKP